MMDGAMEPVMRLFRTVQVYTNGPAVQSIFTAVGDGFGNRIGERGESAAAPVHVSFPQPLQLVVGDHPPL